jgi:hypothetical protein
MGKISNIFYTEIDPEICSINDAAKYHYHFNLIKYHQMFQDEYERYETIQIKLRNTLIGNAIKSGEINGHPKLMSTIFGISSKKNKAVIITEI